jgi:hypothetical protein
MQKVLAIFGLAVAFTAGSALSAHAQFPCYGGGFGGFGGYNVYTNSDRPPFYAMFPPVYYSYPVPRPYGYSPFAYPPGTMTPEVLSVPLASTITNPFVAPENVSPPVPTMPSTPGKPQELPGKAKETSHRVADGDHLQRIKVVSNPYVTQENQPSE